MDILKQATLVRDPITFEVNVPFETRPSRTSDMKDMAWNKILKDAIEQLDDDYLKEKCTINDSTIEATSMGSIANYCISRVPDYIKIYKNSVMERLYDHIKNKAIATFTEFRNTRHAVVLNTKIYKDGRRLQALDLSGSGE